MFRTTKRLTRRPGFTLVELMVAAALCVFIMAILATAFQSGIDTLRNLRSIGDMQDQLRAAGEVLKRDLAASHFLEEEGKPNKGRRVSDQWIHLLGATGNTYSGWTPPRAGFFRIKSDPVFFEGNDQDSLQATRATNHQLHFTSILPGGTEQDMYVANGTNDTLFSRAAEVCYFLDTTGPVEFAGGDPNVRMYKLYRRQRLVKYFATDLANVAAADADVVALVTAGGVRAIDMATVTNPGNRLTPAPLGGARYGDDVLLSNVISFEVRVAWEPAVGVPGPRPMPVNFPLLGTGEFMPTNNDIGVFDDPLVYNRSTEYPYDTLPHLTPGPNVGGNLTLTPRYIFDTWTNQGTYTNWNSTTATNNTLPMRLRVKAVQIRIRIFDPKVKQARQVTFVQDL